MTQLAEDLMQTQVVTVGTNDPIASVFRLFTDEEISGAPVVDEYGRVVGVVSIRDLLRSNSEEQENTQTDLDYFREGLAYAKSEGMIEDHDFEERLSQRMVSDVMTEDVIAVGRQTPIGDVVNTGGPFGGPETVMVNSCVSKSPPSSSARKIIRG